MVPIHLALLASEAGNQEVRGSVWPLGRGLFPFQQEASVLRLVHEPGVHRMVSDLRLGGLQGSGR